MNEPTLYGSPPPPPPFFTRPLFSYHPVSHVAFVFNEGGRGFTLSIYRRPFAARVYLAGRVWLWRR
jgi:hypothetical protein